MSLIREMSQILSVNISFLSFVCFTWKPFCFADLSGEKDLFRMRSWSRPLCPVSGWKPSSWQRKTQTSPLVTAIISPLSSGPTRWCNRRSTDWLKHGLRFMSQLSARNHIFCLKLCLSLPYTAHSAHAYYLTEMFSVFLCERTRWICVDLSFSSINWIKRK